MSSEKKKRKIKLGKSKKNVNSADNGDFKSGLEVINGSRKRRKIIRIVSLAVAVVLIVTVLILNALTPTGLIEYMQNGYAAMGSGDYPISVYAVNASYFGCRNDAVSILNDTYFELYNADGKLLQAVSHGMSNPVLEESEARFLLYDRERYSIIIYNYYTELYTAKFEKPIFAADIGRDGTYAGVTDSDTYKNTVFVYNRDNELIFTWNSASYDVLDVAVSRDGESIAVCLIDLDAGSFKSYVYILGFDNASPMFQQSFDDVVSSITSVGEYILINGFDKAYTLSWTSGTLIDLGIAGDIIAYDFRFEANSSIVYGREDNKQVNTVTVISETGSVIASFPFNAAVTDIAVNETNVAVLSPTKCYIYDFGGNLISEFATDVKGLYVGLSDDGEVIVLDNSKLTKYS